MGLNIQPPSFLTKVSYCHLQVKEFSSHTASWSDPHHASCPPPHRFRHLSYFLKNIFKVFSTLLPNTPTPGLGLQIPEQIALQFGERLTASCQPIFQHIIVQASSQEEADLLSTAGKALLGSK